MNGFAELKVITCLIICSGIVFIEQVVSNSLNHTKQVDDSNAPKIPEPIERT